MTEKHLPPSTQTALPTQSLPPLNPVSSAPIPKTFSHYAPHPPSSVVAPSTDTNPITAALAAPSQPVRDASIPKAEPATEEEPYTIKCICGYTGDDGNTIYCEICDSWQHIECFYPNNSEEATREEFAHACHECKPRQLNIAHAIEYQKKRLQVASAEASVNQKPKRPPSKNHSQSHKKKAKPSELHINGHSSSASDVTRHQISSHEASGQHAHSLKKPKSLHKSSQSVGGSHSKRSPSYSASRATLQLGHPLSPATTPPDLPDGVDVYNFSNDFLTLYNDQDTVQHVQTNSFASLAVSNATSIWLREPQRMSSETGHKFTDVFQALPQNIDAIRRPPRVEVKTRTLGQDSVVHWRFLANSVAVDKDVPLMELNGQVGFQKDYCSIPANRYEDLSCPLPFVFFHPLLPLYIDTRREGSNARYVRRSCRPNAVLDTYLSGGSEYQFWLVSDRRIAPDEQITIPWDFRLPHDAKGRMLRLLGLGDDDASSHDDVDVEEDEYNSIARWISLILSRYGGCACDLGLDCAFARFHRQYGGKTQHAQNGQGGNPASHNKKKSSRKAKQSHALSPTSTGHATNSRAASEGHLDDFPEADKMSTSSRSKPPSRDMTPAPRQGSFDTLGILTEPTDRDKRKVAMVEDSFRRLEQQPRKKKRTSDGTTTTEKSSSSGKPKSKSISSSSSTQAGGRSSSTTGDQIDLVHGSLNRQYVDAGTSRSKSGSPDSARSPLTANGGNNYGFPSLSTTVGSVYSASRYTSTGPSGYCDSGTQTDPTEGEWYSENPPTPRPKRRVISLSRRLLNNRYRVRVEDAQQPIPAAVFSSTDGDKLGTALDANQSIPSAPNADTPMPDACSGLPANAPATKVEPSAAEGVDVTLPIKKSPDLRVQLPKIAPFNDGILPSLSMTATPLSASSIIQSPFAAANTNSFGSSIATPSPIKKKMSLSDYTKSRKAAASRPSVGTTLKPLVSSIDEPKPAISPDGVTAGESPTGEKTGDILSAENATTNSTTSSK